MQSRTVDERDMKSPPNGTDYVMSALFPPIGLVLGVVMLARGYVGPGLALMLTSVAVAAVVLAVAL
jgi:hypothetical protein